VRLVSSLYYSMRRWYPATNASVAILVVQLNIDSSGSSAPEYFEQKESEINRRIYMQTDTFCFSEMTGALGSVFRPSTLAQCGRNYIRKPSAWR